MSLAVGDKLGPYEILGRLGAGGMGEVFRARDTRLNRAVAIKVLPPGVAHDAEALQRLEREARAIAALNHPNLLTIFDVGTLSSGAPYLVSELLEGKTLRQELAEGPLPAPRATDYAAQIARGLAAAHAKGIVHRDLKPENLFCCEDGRVKVLDFGLAKIDTVGAGIGDDRTALEPGPPAAPATGAGVVLGTVGYMAPEQARGRPADARSDIFSLGAVLYEMLTGRRAFHGDSSADVISAILREEPEEMVATGRAVAPALDRIVRHCLEKEPARRFQSASDIGFQLENLSLAGSGLGSSVGSSAAVSAAPSSRSRRRLGFALAGTIGLALAIGLTWFWARATLKPSAPVFDRLTYKQGIITAARLLPNGQGFVAMARWNQDASSSLLLGRLDNPGLQTLSNQVQGLWAVADSGELAVRINTHELPDAPPTGTLARLPANGGVPRPVLDGVESADWRSGDLGRDAAVSRYLPATAETTVEYPVGHILYKTRGFVSDLRLSPDGQRLAFLEHPVLFDDKGHVAVVEARGGAERNLTGDFPSIGGLAWALGGREIWFSAGSMARGLHAVDLAGHARLLLQDTNDLQIFDVDSTGRPLVASSDRRYLVKLIAPGRPGATDVSVLNASVYCHLSDDGKQIAVGEESDGANYSTYLQDTTGSAPVRLGDGEPMGISPDGKWVVSILPNAPRPLLLLPTGVGQPRPLTHANISFSAEVGVGWLSDSRSLVAIGNLPGRPLRSFLIGLDGHATPITPEGTYGSTVSPDGRSLLVLTTEGKAAAVVPLAGLPGSGTAVPVPGWSDDDFPLRFLPGGDLLVARQPAIGSAAAATTAAFVYRVNPRSGARVPLATVLWPDSAGIVHGVWWMDGSSDGKLLSLGYERQLSTLCLIGGLR